MPKRRHLQRRRRPNPQGGPGGLLALGIMGAGGYYAWKQGWLSSFGLTRPVALPAEPLGGQIWDWAGTFKADNGHAANRAEFVARWGAMGGQLVDKVVGGAGWPDRATAIQWVKDWGG